VIWRMSFLGMVVCVMSLFLFSRILGVPRDSLS